MCECVCKVCVYVCACVFVCAWLRCLYKVCETCIPRQLLRIGNSIKSKFCVYTHLLFTLIACIHEYYIHEFMYLQCIYMQCTYIVCFYICTCTLCTYMYMYMTCTSFIRKVHEYNYNIHVLVVAFFKMILCSLRSIMYLIVFPVL